MKNLSVMLLAIPLLTLYVACNAAEQPPEEQPWPSTSSRQQRDLLMQFNRQVSQILGLTVEEDVEEGTEVKKVPSLPTLEKKLAINERFELMRMELEKLYRESGSAWRHQDTKKAIDLLKIILYDLDRLLDLLINNAVMFEAERRRALIAGETRAQAAIYAPYQNPLDYNTEMIAEIRQNLTQAKELAKKTKFSGLKQLFMQHDFAGIFEDFEQVLDRLDRWNENFKRVAVVRVPLYREPAE